MTKEDFKELTTLTKSKDIIKFLLDSNDEELNNDIMDILKALSITSRKDNEKYTLIKLFIEHKDKKYMKTLVSSSLIVTTNTFGNQLSKIKEYILNENAFEKIINESYIKFMQNQDNEEIYKLKP